MIISENRNPSLEEFSSLVLAATALLNDEAKENEKYYLTRNAQLLEKDVYRALTQSAVNTKFQDTITVVSGQKFPDIVAAKYYGVEVKSSKDDKWITLGGSVNESTRVENVERIYLTFGKLLSPVEFKSRPYEDCLSEVVATHYPRYKIDMSLDRGQTIFDKMQLSYNELRQTGNPVSEIVKYYKSKLKPGESLWWIDNGDTVDNNATATLIVRLWSSLSKAEKDTLTKSIIIFFPEIFGAYPKKYERAALWLASRHGVVSTSMRDTFSAGGTVTIVTQKSGFKDVPQIFGHIYDFAADIRLQIAVTDENLLCEMWNVSAIDSNRISQWIATVSENCRLKNCDAELCEKILTAIFE
jgi:hypothetical protein